jgi:pimeloyl-ACP methyl ester carboxylesterase
MPSAAAQPPSLPAGVEECWTEIECARVRYLKAGSGPAVVLVHGLLGYSFSWRFNMGALAERHTVYALDLPGVGFSERRPQMDCSMTAAAARLLQFLDLTGISKTHLVGSSQGGAICVYAAAAEPQRFSKLVLVAPANPWSSQGRVLIDIFSSAAGAEAFRRGHHLLRPVHGVLLARMYGDRHRIRPGTIEGYAAPMGIPGTADYLLSVVACWNADLGRLETALRKIKDIPTLLLWGSRDGAVYPESGAEVARRLPAAELVFIKGAGHLPYEEFPERFNRVVGEFLSRA